MKLPTVKYVFDRKKNSSNTKKGSIELRVTFNKTQKFMSTGIKCYPGQWDEKREETANMIESLEYNEILAKIRLRTIKAINAMIDSETFDLDTLMRSLKAGDTSGMTFTAYIYERMKKKPVSDYTKKAYHVFYSRFVEWGGMKLFSDISEKNIRDWDEHLKSVRWTEKDRYGRNVERKYSQASIGSMHKNLKVFIADAVVDGLAKENPYSTKRIKIDKGGTRIDQFLTAEEVLAIETATMPTRSLSESRDLFLIQCYTGLSYVDLMAYNFAQCRNADDYAVFSGIRSKTGTIFTFVLTPKAKVILEKYDYNLPKLPNQKYNMRLKLIADAAGIDSSISSHTGRRSCGSILLNAGVPMAVVSRVLGHSSVRQTEAAYARLTDKTIAEEIKKHIK